MRTSSFVLLAAVSLPIALVAACGGSAFTSGAGGAGSGGSTANGPSSVDTGTATTSGPGGSTSTTTGAGGMSTTSTGGGGQTSTSTGAGGQTSTSTGTGGSDVCPKAPPTEGAACVVDGKMCMYEDYATCCTDTFSCSDHAWSAGPSTCNSPPQCPASPPVNGSACTCKQQCIVGKCGGQTPPSVATCANQTWTVAPEVCPNTTPCPSLPCDPGNICLIKVGGPPTTPTCVADPCANLPLSCDCAKPIECSGSGYLCSSNGTDSVTCTCPLCPDQ